MSHSLTFSRFLDAAPQWNRGARYVLGLATTVLALALSGALVEPLGGVCFAIPLAVIALLSLLAGQGPGLVASGAIVVGIWFFLLEPRYSLAIYHQVDTFRLVLVFISSALISIVAGSQHKARARLVLKRAAARKAAREAELASEEARRSNEALRASEQRFRQLADSMPQIVWASSPDGTLDYYNRKWYELTGAEPGTSGDTSWLPILHPDDRQKCLDIWYESVRTGRPYQIEYRFRFRETGEYRWHLGRALPVRDEHGNIVRWYGTSTDIHDSKRTEATLRESEERYRMLAEALREADQRKNQFLAMLSHELRNPLAPIRNSLHILERAAPGSEQARRAQRVAERQVAHMTRLIDDLLDVTRISRGKIQLQRGEPFELNELVRRTAEDHRSVFEHCGVALELQLASRPIWVNGDVTRLEQVVGNLLQNAAKFTDRGGRTRLSLEPLQGQQRVLLRVSDTGMGIAPELLPKLFEPFSQADTSLERSRGGLGLGLALVKGLVELHGGEVWASSEGPGRGTELTVCLPEVSTPGAVGLPSSEPARQPHPRRVLVIEDNVDAAESLKEALELSGHAVSVAHSGSEGLARARELSPEVILCDIGLPGMDGYEVARALRADPALRSVGLVALTGYASPDDQRRAREAGFQLHLAKPPDLDVLERVVDELGGLREDDAQRHLLAGEEAGEGGRVPGRFDDEVVLVEAHAPQAGAAPVGAEYE